MKKLWQRIIEWWYWPINTPEALQPPLVRAIIFGTYCPACFGTGQVQIHGKIATCPCQIGGK